MPSPVTPAQLALPIHKLAEHGDLAVGARFDVETR